MTLDTLTKNGYKSLERAVRTIPPQTQGEVRKTMYARRPSVRQEVYVSKWGNKNYQITK